MKVELVTRSVGVGRYEGLSPGEIIEAVARHGNIKSYGKLITYLVQHGHFSPLEHIHYTFRVETSRAISAQIFRHRSLHFQEQSQRYDEITEFEPVEIRRQAESNRQSSTEVFNPTMWKKDSGMDVNYHPSARKVIEGHLKETREIYSELLKQDVARESARMILPMTSKTVIHITGNLRDLLAFLNQRCDRHAQKEVREIALEMGAILAKELPLLFDNIDWRNGMFMYPHTEQQKKVGKALSHLEAVLTDPEGNVSLQGSEGDAKIIEMALELLKSTL